MKEEVSLPDNAFRPLKEGEEYEPLMKPNKQYREVTPWSIVWGLLMAVIFSAATAYLGLKVGQVFEAAIPITIIAVGVSGATHRKDPLGENIIIQSRTQICRNHLLWFHCRMVGYCARHSPHFPRHDHCRWCSSSQRITRATF